MTIIEREETKATSARWSVDRGETSVDFAVKTFWGMSTVNGRFDRFGGSTRSGRTGRRSS